MIDSDHDISQGIHPRTTEQLDRHVLEVEARLVDMDRLLDLSLREGLATKTDYRIACAVRYTDGSWTLGVNSEQVEPFRHAEIHALSNKPSDTLVTHAYLVGGGPKGPVDALKHAIPCKMCINELSVNSQPGALVTLFTQEIPELNGLRLGNPFRLEEIIQSYKSYSEIPCPGEQSPEEFLTQNTKLIPIDRQLLQSLVGQLSKELGNDYELYITGSASGRGGPKGLVAEKFIGIPYGDIDIVLITPTNVTQLDQKVGMIYQTALSIVGVDEPIDVKEVLPYLREQELTTESTRGKLHARLLYAHKGAFQESKLIFPKHYLKELPPSSIDVTFGNDVEEVMTPEYLEKGWYVRLK